MQEVVKVNLNLKAHSKGVTCLAFASDSSRAVTASKDGTWAVWNLQVRYHLNEDPKLLSQQSQVCCASPDCFRNVNAACISAGCLPGRHDGISCAMCPNINTAMPDVMAMK